jgi:hypothetical protein
MQCNAINSFFISLFCILFFLILDVFAKSKHYQQQKYIKSKKYSKSTNNNSQIIECDVNNGSRNFRILISLTDEHIPIFLNWLIYYSNVCINLSTLFIICLDKQVEKNLVDYGFRCSHVQYLSSIMMLSRIWFVRIKVAKQLLSQGLDVFMSDIDALWIKDPFKELSKNVNSDIIASRAFFPEEISQALGSSICMGFIYIKSSQRTIKLWQELLYFMAKADRANDQHNLNQFLLY